MNILSANWKNTNLSTFCFTVNQGLRNAALEDCALCQESISSSELAAKARDGDFEGTFFFLRTKMRQH